MCKAAKAGGIILAPGVAQGGFEYVLDKGQQYAVTGRVKFEDNWKEVRKVMVYIPVLIFLLMVYVV